MIIQVRNTHILLLMLTIFAMLILLRPSDSIGKSGSLSNKTVVEGSSKPNKVIPDDDLTGISDTINISDDIATQCVHIEVDASELSNLNDLEITLTSPKGTKSVFLKPHSIGGRIYPQPGASVRFRQGEEAFVGETSQGAWKITVKDLVKGNTGALKSWTIRIYSTK